jgi:LuxR family transcriptional regulator, maltose regulon positive regulatory protein
MSSRVADFRFSVPPLPPHHVSRPRLLGFLDEAESAGLTLVSAGAGAGKTVLLTDWARRQDGPVAWLALTSEDDDPRRFWRLFLEGGGVHGQVYPPWSSGRTVELLDFVYGRGPPQPRLTVVLDDAHVLTDPQITDGLDRLVRRWSHRVRLLMTARSDPLLPLHRYRLAGQLCEIRAPALAMTEPEAGELLGAHGLSLSERDLRLLTGRTEGWAAGLRLAALRMLGTGHPAEFVALFALDQGSVGEYLTEEVLAQLPHHVTRLLVETSFLEEVTGPLADAVTGMAGCGAVLEGLARTNSFVIPLDPDRTAFRYQQLFREVLRHLANRQPAELVRRRYARAAGWYRRQGDLASALRWTVRSEDPAAIRALLVRGGLAEAFARRQDLAGIGLHRVADDPPPAGAPPAEHLEFAVARWAAGAVSAEPATAAETVRRLPPLHPELEAAEPALRVAATVAQLILAQLAGDHDLLDRTADRLLADPELARPAGAVPGLRAVVLLTLARSRCPAGRLAEVEPLLRRALDQAEQEDTGLPVVVLEVLCTLAFVAASAGRLRHAEAALRRAGAVLDDHAELRPPVTLELAVARRAELAADWTTMGQAVGRALAAGPVYADAGIAAAVAFAQASHLAGLGELARAAALLRHHKALTSSSAVLGALRDRELADIEIRLGRPHAALRLVEPHQQAPTTVLVGVTAARAHLALGDLRRALGCVGAVRTTPSELVNRQLAVEAELVEAEIADRAGEEGRAAELVDRALALADGELALPFVRTAAAFSALLSRHPALAGRWPIAAPELPTDPVPAVGTEPAVELPDPLTSRERAVLRLVATTMSSAEIADELHLSINTVKSHLAAIYRKLSVGRRRDAVLRARELELL